MAAKYEARAEAFWNQEQGGSDDGWGYATAGYCKTADEAEQAETYAECIYKAIDALTGGCGTWADVQVIRAAVAERDGLDAGLAIVHEQKKEMSKC
jgi:hypothetical protein